MSYLRLKPAHLACVAISFALVWLSGVVWLGLRLSNGSHLFEGGYASDSQLLLMKAHSLTAYFLLLCLGSMLFHIKEGLKGKKNKFSGIVMLGSFIALIISGWGLYYIGEDSYRWTASFVHCIVGGQIGAVFLTHWSKARHYLFGLRTSKNLTENTAT